jgi:hypothetical protein
MKKVMIVPAPAENSAIVSEKPTTAIGNEPIR